MALKAIKGITVEIGGDTVGLQKALNEADKSSKILDSELKQVNNALKLDPTNTTLLAQKQQILSEQVKNTSDKLQQLKSVQSQVEQKYKSGDIGADAYRAFQREIISTENRLQGLQSEQNDVEKATDKASDSTKQFSVSLDGAKTVAGGFVSAAATVVDGLKSLADYAVKAGQDFVNMVDSVGNAGDAIDKSSQAAGMSAEAYQEWGYVLQRNGASADSLSTWMKKLNNNVDDAVSGTDSAVEKFTRLGISVDDLQNKSREDVFAEVITSLQGMENESERAAAVNDLLGGSATDLGALLNATSEDTQSLRDNAHALGLVMSDEAVADSAAYADAMLDLQSAFTGVKNSIASEVLPNFTEVLQGLTGMVIGTQGASEVFSNGIKNIVSAVTEILPNVGETIADITTTITEIVPDIVTSISTLINSVANTLTENAPSIAKSAGEIVRSLASGFVSNSETVLNAVLSIGESVMNELPSVLSSLTAKAGQFASTIVYFLSSGIQLAAQNIPQILSALSVAIPETLPFLTQSVFDLITSAVSSLLELIPEILPTVIELVTSLIELLLPDIIQTAVTLAESIAENLPEILTAIVTALPTLIDGILTAVLGQIPVLLQGVFTIVNTLIGALPNIIVMIAQTIPQIITAIINAVTTNLPIIVQTGVTLFTSLIGALPNIIKALVAALPQIITSLVSATVESLPQLIDGAIQLVLGIVEAIPEIIDALIEATPEIISAVVTGLTDALPQLIEGGIQLTLGVVKAIPQIITELIKAVPDIVTSLVTAFGNCIDMFVDIGGQLITGLWNGINNAADWLWEQISSFFGGIVDGIKDFFGIHSPSTLFRDQIGENLALGIGEGFSDTMTDVTKDMQNALPTSFDIDPDVNITSGDMRMQTLPQSTSILSAVQSGMGSVNFTLNIENFNNADSSALINLSDTITYTLYELIYRKKAVTA